MERELVILMYHHVAPPPPRAPVPGLYVSPAQFAWQLDWLRRAGVEFVTCAQLEGEAAAGAPSAPGAAAAPRVMLTFDDGYRDVYGHAFPELARRGIAAVVYPVVGDLGRTGVRWPENDDQTPADLMTEDQVREMARAGVEFGSHLWDHRHAPLLSPEELHSQLARSRDRLRELLGQPPLSVAYPYGAYNDQVVEQARLAGYRYGLTTDVGSNRGVSPLRLRRVPIKGTRLHHRWRFQRTMGRLLQAAQAA